MCKASAFMNPGLSETNIPPALLLETANSKSFMPCPISICARFPPAHLLFALQVFEVGRLPMRLSDRQLEF